MRLKLLFLLFFVFSSIWAQPPHTFSTPGSNTFKVPAGVVLLDIECWGAGGAGGGATAVVSVFGGGGGGGGAYGKVSLVVTPATTLNYKVGAGGTGANGGDGGNGEATTFSTVTANGGTGGKNGNSSNGVGGSGGLASGTGTIYSGGNGGTPGLVGGILSSGGGGGSAGTSANGNNGTLGTGGAAVTGGGAGSGGVLLAGDGVNNVSLGGGGGGAKGLLLSDYHGGNGGNGQIKVNYTCPTYNFSGISAPDVCTSVGTTSLVVLTGALSSLPVGDYVVTYNRSNPSLGGTGLTATATVTTAGELKFTATGLNATGTSKITVTNLKSESCTNSTFTVSEVTINVYSASVAGTINTPPAICSGGTSGLLTLSGSTGTVLGWESSVFPFSSWTPIVNITSTYAPGVLTQTTQFRAIVKNGACSQQTSAAITVTVNPLPGITTSGTLNDICIDSSAQLAILPYSGTTNTPVNYSIVWSAAANTAGLTNQGITAFSFLPGGGNLNNIIIPAGVAANTYLGTMTIFNANCSVTQPIQLTIKPKPTAPITGTVTEPTCVTSTGSVNLSGLPSSVTWLIKQSGTASTTYTSTGITYLVTNLAPGNYTFTVEYAGSCISPSSANVVINNLVTNTYNGGWSNGTPTIDQNLVFASNHTSAGGGFGDISGCTCMINSGISVVMNNFDTLTINKAVVNNGGTLTFENNASLVQMANVSNTGNIVFKRISKPMKNFDFTYWGSPVTGQTLFNLSPNTLSDKFFSFTGTDWKEENAPTTAMIPGKGYIIRSPKEGLWPNGENVVFPYSQRVQFVGVPNNGNISGESVITGNSYLIGNPYPSALDADAFLFSNPNNSAILDGTIYFWTHNTAIQQNGSQYEYSSGDYASYNGSGGVATVRAPSANTGGLNADIPSGKIAAGQSFFATAKANGTIVFNNGMRVSGNNNQFFKPAKTAKPNLFEKHRLWLDMTNVGGAFKQLLIGYIEGATNNFDSNFDGLSFDGNTFIDFYSINEDSNLVIQGRSLPFTDSDTVPLGYRTTIAGDFIISIDQTDGLFANKAVYLEDKLTNTINNLSQANYTFTTATGVFNNRFVLRYTNETLATDDFKQNSNNVLVWIDHKNIRIRSNVENINKVFIYDISGKLVYSDSEISSSEVIISNLKFKNEVLLTKIILANNQTISKKIIINTE